MPGRMRVPTTVVVERLGPVVLGLRRGLRGGRAMQRSPLVVKPLATLTAAKHCGGDYPNIRVGLVAAWAVHWDNADHKA